MEFRSGTARVRVNVPDRAALDAVLADRLRRGEGFALATLNLDHLVKLRSDPSFASAYGAQDLVTADGNPVVWLSRLARRPVTLLPGADLVLPIAGMAAAAGVPVALVGSTDDSLARAGRAMQAAVPGLQVAARIAPPMGFDPAGEGVRALLDELSASGARVVFLALGAPKQERLAALGRQRTPDLGFVSIGAGLDFLAGSQRRAPAWVRRIAMEWLWRMLSNPRRLARRYALSALILPGQVAGALRQRFGHSAGR